MKNLYNENERGKSMYLETILFQCHFDRYKTHRLDRDQTQLVYIIRYVGPTHRFISK
jgi:hypothetical protein